MTLRRAGVLLFAVSLGCSSSSGGGGDGIPGDGGGLDATHHGDGAVAAGDGGKHGDGGGAGGSSSGGPTADCGPPPLPLPSAGGDAGADGGEGGIEGGGGPVGLPPGTTFCAISSAGELDCPTGDECCLGGSVSVGVQAPAECAVFGAPCTNGSAEAGAGIPAAPIECARVLDCRANGLAGATACCLHGASQMQGCAFPFFTGGGSILCEGGGDGGTVPVGDGGVTPCAISETQVCETAADCPAPAKCVAATWRGRPFGVCQ